MWQANLKVVTITGMILLNAIVHMYKGLRNDIKELELSSYCAHMKLTSWESLPGQGVILTSGIKIKLDRDKRHKEVKWSI